MTISVNPQRRGRPGRSPIAAMIVAAQLVACAPRPAETSDAPRPPEPSDAPRPKQSARVPSPSGWCEAYVVDWGEENAQVILDFDGGACGGGAVSAFGKAPGLALRWTDATTLEVRHSPRVRMERSASGEIIQCGGPHRRVRVVLDPP